MLNFLFLFIFFIKVLKNIFPTFNSETLETKTMEKKIK